MSQDISMKNTKKELLEVIEKMQQELKAKEQLQLNPEKVKTEAKNTAVIKKAAQVVTSDLGTQIHALKTAIGKELNGLAERIANEAEKYTTLQDSILLKQKELEEIYSIEREAASLVVMLESQKQTKEQFDREMTDKNESLSNELADKKEKLEAETERVRAAWDQEKKAYNDKLAEEKDKQAKERQREEEEYAYTQQRTRSLEENAFSDKMAIMERELQEKQEQVERLVREKTETLDDREQAIADRKETMHNLEEKVAAFPGELQTAVNAAVAGKEKELTNGFTQEKALLAKGFEGEQKVLEAKITALESLVKDQAKQIEKLNNQQEKAYSQVQDIAAKAVAGASERPHLITVKNREEE